MPHNRARGLAQVSGLGALGLYVFFRARAYDHAEALLIAVLGGLGSGLLAACYYWRVRLLWHDFGDGRPRSRLAQVAEVCVNVLVVCAAIACLVVIVGEQGEN